MVVGKEGFIYGLVRCGTAMRCPNERFSPSGLFLKNFRLEKGALNANMYRSGTCSVLEADWTPCISSVVIQAEGIQFRCVGNTEGREGGRLLFWLIV